MQQRKQERAHGGEYGEQYHVNGAEHDVDGCALHDHVVHDCIADLDNVHNDDVSAGVNDHDNAHARSGWLDDGCE